MRPSRNASPGLSPPPPQSPAMHLPAGTRPRRGRQARLRPTLSSRERRWGRNRRPRPFCWHCRGRDGLPRRRGRDPLPASTRARPTLPASSPVMTRRRRRTRAKRRSPPSAQGEEGRPGTKIRKWAPGRPELHIPAATKKPPSDEVQKGTPQSVKPGTQSSFGPACQT